jgi:hypothetical protein
MTVLISIPTLVPTYLVVVMVVVDTTMVISFPVGFKKNKFTIFFLFLALLSFLEIWFKYIFFFPSFLSFVKKTGGDDGGDDDEGGFKFDEDGDDNDDGGDMSYNAGGGGGDDDFALEEEDDFLGGGSKKKGKAKKTKAKGGDDFTMDEEPSDCPYSYVLLYTRSCFTDIFVLYTCPYCTGILFLAELVLTK